tara:strand:- start:161 stop:1201 length:1041 start_codon:yes stop_codon:yes gene_type:complete
MKNQKKINRRNWLQLGIGATIGTISLKILGCKESSSKKETIVENCVPTQYDTMGPFHPNKDQSDKDFDLTSFNGAAEKPKGELIYVRGKVTDVNCNPISGALVMIWHANTHGKYTHEYDTNKVEDDPNFQGWGQMKTNEEGEYGFKTIKPGKYAISEGGDDWRTPHIHFKVAKRGFHELITQMYFEEEKELNEKDAFASGLSDIEKSQVIRKRQKGINGIETEASLINFNITLKNVLKEEKDKKIFADYIGDYELNLSHSELKEELNIFYGGKRNEMTLTISQENGVLYAEMPIQPKCEIFPKSKDRYIYRAFEADIEFKRNEEKQVTGLIFHRHYDFPEITANKI